MNVPKHEYPINYFREAFQLPINLVFLTFSFFVFLSSVFLNLYLSDWLIFRLPSEAILTFSLSIEFLFLAWASHNSNFQKKIKQKYYSLGNIYNHELQIAQIISVLSRDSLAKFMKFFNRKNQLLQKSIDSGASMEGILTVIKENTDKLTKTYAQLLLINELYHKHFAQTDLSQLKKELKQIQNEIEHSEGRKKNLLQQRAELLQKRIQKLTHLQEEFSVSELQLKTIEDTLEYLYENSLTKSNLSEFVQTIDNIYQETEIYQNALQEIQELTKYD